MSEGPSQRLRSRPRGRGESFSFSRGGDSSPYGAHRLAKKPASLSLTNECVTNVEPVLLTQRWTLSQPGLCLRSSVFKDPSMPDACWQLCLYPGGKRPENANNVSLFLKMSATSPLKEVIVKAEYRFFFLDEDDEIKFSNVNIGDFHAKPPKGGHSWGLRNIPRQKVQNSIRADHSLVISCTIELLPDAGRIPCRRVEPNALVITDMAEVSRAHMSNELAMFTGMECAPYADLNVAVGPKDDRIVYAVHKYKLVTHSDVFRAMLDHDMEESKVIVKAEYRFFFLDEDDEIKFSNVQNSIRADHSLVISCTIELLPDAGRIPCRRVEPNALVITDMAEVSRAHMSNELAMFTGMECAPYADLNVAVGPKDDRIVYAVHKYKLVTHSDVFRAMLDHDMEESKTNTITIEEFSHSAVKIMLTFIYTGAISPHELELEDASDVMVLAEKYNIPALKTMCEQDLISRVCAANVVDCMELADYHQASHLYEHCLDFVSLTF
ncbi:BTB/POZ domain protein [Ancylostoma duodenale]|uniref:BTB/POZ domain protein n=1 Tax=Ancylostoma duodenale TaxID=51022 RepID=A0A0C2CC13_9BILA|nr:BTB/POZ domain protein [Ancylostoma duodenale]